VVDLAATAIDAAIIAIVGVVFAWVAKGRWDATDRRIDRLEQRMDRRFEAVDRRFERLEDRLDASFDGLRADITQIALAVGARPRAQND
jgi:hypothetical protein